MPARHGVSPGPGIPGSTGFGPRLGSGRGPGPDRGRARGLAWAARGLLLALCFALQLGGGRALAAGANDPDDGCLKDPECRGHYDKAIGQYEAGRYNAALPEFQAAYQTRQMPWLLINIGRTLHRLGRLQEAISYYERYQKAAPNGDPETQKKVAEYMAQARVLLEAKSATEQPEPVVAPAVPVTPPQPVPDSGAAAAKPIYKKWWFWTIVGVAVAGTVTGIAVGVATRGDKNPFPDNAAVYVPMF